MSLREVRESPDIAKRGRFAVPRFCGWSQLQEFYDSCPTEEIRAIFAVLFETGCRVSEALKLRGDMFTFDDDTWLTVYRAPVLKKNHKPSKRKIPDHLRLILSPEQIENLDNYLEETQPKPRQKQAPFRNIPILRKEPLVEPLMEYVKTHPDQLFRRSRSWVWRRIVEVDDRWWCHRIRSERATQLHIEYEYEVPELMKWFNWSEPKEALEYVRLGTSDLKAKVLKAVA